MRTRRLFRSVLFMLCMMTAFVFLTVTAQAEPQASTVTVKTVSGKTYLYDASGKKYKGLTGVQELPKGSKNYSYFRNTSGRIYASGWFTKDSKTYYAGKDGKLKRGWQTINKRVYYFNTKTLARTTGWKKLKGKYYYFSSKGTQITGWLKWKKYTYYLDPADNHAKSIGWKTINKKTYYFNKNGRMQIGLLTIDGKKYFTDKTGVRKTGLITFKNHIYYFDKKNKGVMKTGWVTVKGKKYYMSNSSSRKGQAVTGWMSLGGSRYYFNTVGVMQKGWLALGNKKYYLDTKTGKMYTGKHTISGKTYDFGKNGYITVEPTGEWSIQVNQTTCVVTIFRGSTPVKAFLCSVGAGGATPDGTRYIGCKHRWWELDGPSWGQYCEHLVVNPGETFSPYLFHSIPYNRYQDPRSLTAYSYNMLGQPASHGCIRLNVQAAMYIYNNVPVGTRVRIFHGTSANDPLGKPSLKTIPSYQTWDPTDPNV